ncbi:MAG: 3-oxoacyl-[acyl-carrier-protein] synthase III C-terminal domain-containing protein [Deferribacterales bacterium]
MIINGLGVALPSKLIDNEEICDLIKYYTLDLSKQELNNTLLNVRNFFQYVGAKTRSWLAKNEEPIDLITCAFEKSLNLKQLSHNEIDVVIYCSIHRAVIEPSSASIVCKWLGLNPKLCFDIVDACMGWATAAEIANTLIKVKGYEHVLIITSEFPNNEGGALIPGCYTLSSVSDLQNKIAGFTMGEAATATIISKDENNSGWECVRTEFPEHSKLCYVPLHGFKRYFHDTNSDMTTFHAEMSKLASVGYKPSCENVQKYISVYGKPDVVIPHSVSEVFPKKIAKKLNIDIQIHNTFSKYGNLATSSVPVSLDNGIKTKTILSNNHIVGVISSAGMKFSTFRLNCNKELFIYENNQNKLQ